MDKQVILYLGFFVIGNILAFRYHPFFGLIAYIHVYYNVPNYQYWGGQLPAIRWSFISGILLLLSCIIHRDKLTTNPLPITFHILTGYFIMVIITSLASPFSYYTSSSIYEFFRYLIIFSLTIKIIGTLTQYKYIALLFLFEAFNICMLGRHRFQGGRLDQIGIVDAGSANLFSSLLVMLMPFIFSLFLCENRYFKLACLLFTPFILDVFIMGGSRGAFIGFVLMGLFILFNSVPIKKIRWQVIAVCIIGIVGLFSLMSDQYKERLFSTAESSEEKSADELSAGRTEVWRYGLQMSKDYPFGAGGRSFMYLSPDYIPEHRIQEGVGQRAAHNTYLQALVEQGYLGLILYCAFLFFSIKMLHDSKKKLVKLSQETEDEEDEEDEKNEEYNDEDEDEDEDEGTKTHKEHLIIYCIGLQASLISLSITSFFADRLYYEMLYLICAMAVCLSNICNNYIDEKSDYAG